jgi:hypothetical protein
MFIKLENHWYLFNIIIFISEMSYISPRDLSPEHNEGNDIILFVFIGLALGQLTKHFCNTVKVSYTL